MTGSIKNRRRFCDAHCGLAELAKNAVPRWVFISSLAAILTISGTVIAALGLFVNWEIANINALGEKIETALISVSVAHEKDMNEFRQLYLRDVQKLYEMVEENQRLLEAGTTERSAIKALQQVVFDKLDLSNVDY